MGKALRHMCTHTHTRTLRAMKLVPFGWLFGLHTVGAGEAERLFNDTRETRRQNHSHAVIGHLQSHMRVIQRVPKRMCDSSPSHVILPPTPM